MHWRKLCSLFRQHKSKTNDSCDVWNLVRLEADLNNEEERVFELGLSGSQVHCRWLRYEVIPSHVLFGGHGHALLDPGIAAEQGEHEASHVSPPYGAAGVGYKVSLVGQELLSWRENKGE